MIFYVACYFKKATYLIMAIVLLVCVVSLILSNITFANTTYLPEVIIGENLTLTDIAYSKTEIANIRAQIILESERLSETYKYLHPKLTQNESTKEFNELIGTIVVQLNSLENSVYGPEDVVGKEGYFKLNINVIDKMIELYNTIIAENILINMTTNQIVSAPSKADLTTKLGIQKDLFVSDITNNATIIAFFEFCKEVCGHNISRKEEDSFYVDGLYYLNFNSKYSKARSRYWLTKIADNGSNYAAAILGAFYKIDLQNYQFKDNKQLKLLSDKYLKQGTLSDIKKIDSNISSVVGHAYELQGRFDITLKWMKAAGKKLNR